MKLKYKLITLGFFFSSIIGSVYCQEKSLRVVYQVAPIVDLENKISKEAEETIILAGEMLSTFEFELLIHGNECVFQKTQEVIESYSDDLLYKLALGFSAGDEVWYTKKGDLEKLIYKRDVEGEKSLTLNEDVEWEIGEETKYVGEYKVTKASATRKMGSYEEKIVAWFTRELPYSFGPIGYNGLPGLILEMNRDNVVFTFKELQEKVVEIVFPKELEQMPFQKYYEVLDARMEEMKNGN